MYKPNIQQMSTSITIQNRVETIDRGKSTISYVPAIPPTAFCNWKTKGGTELTGENSVTVLDTAELIMWYRSDITETSKIFLGSKEYKVMSIENVEQRNQYLIVKVKGAKVG